MLHPCHVSRDACCINARPQTIFPIIWQFESDLRDQGNVFHLGFWGVLEPAEKVRFTINVFRSDFGTDLVGKLAIASSDGCYTMQEWLDEAPYPRKIFFKASMEVGRNNNRRCGRNREHLFTVKINDTSAWFRMIKEFAIDKRRQPPPLAGCMGLPTFARLGWAS